MILRNRRSIKLILACAVGLMVQSCSGDESTQEQMEISQDDQSGAINQEADAPVAEESLAQAADETGSQDEAIAYNDDSAATPPADSSELDKSLDDVLDETFGATTPADSAVAADNYASSEEADTGMSIPALDETPTPAAATDTTTQSIVTQAAHDSPAAQSTWSPTSVSGETFAYIVEPGDTLGTISKKVFGNSNRWQDIANHSNLQNPNMIFPGDELKVPVDTGSQQFVNNLQNQPKKQVVVKAGDTLAKIAQEYFGNSAGWAVIWKQNQDIIKNPHNIYVGQTLAFVHYSQVAYSH